MRRALVLARKGFGKVAPNPMVGAVLVKNGKILSEGYHRKFGGSHAEVDVLKNMAAAQIKGATLYVTLEPCNHFGKTPPCTNFLIKSGIKSLVVAMRDPNPLVSGKGIQELKKAGLQVRVGVLKEEAEKLNEVYIKNITTSLPFVMVKMGMSLDGKITGPKVLPGGITNELSRKEVHRLRAHADAVLTTSQTVILDNPHLGARMVKGRDPLRVVIDSDLRTNLTAKIYRDGNVLVATKSSSMLKKRHAFQKRGVELMVYKGAKVPLKSLLQDLFVRGIYNIMVEAGAGLTTSLLQKRLVDRVTFFIAPKILKQGLHWSTSKKGIKLGNIDTCNFGEDFMVTGTVIY